MEHTSSSSLSTTGHSPSSTFKTLEPINTRQISNIEQSNGLNFGIATAHVAGRDIASSFTATTGMSARYVSLPIEVWHANTWMKLPRGVDTMVGFLSINDDGALLQTYGENFTNWWNLYKASSGNTGLMRGD